VLRKRTASVANVVFADVDPEIVGAGEESRVRRGATADIEYPLSRPDAELISQQFELPLGMGTLPREVEGRTVEHPVSSPEGVA
jgi:hypothetical protein